jgi:hypothetical protein
VEPEKNIEHSPAIDLGTVSGPVRPLLQRLCGVVREELRIGTLYRPDCCIAATAVLIDVLDYFRLTARPLRVIATVYNPAMSERILREGMPTLAEAERDWFPNGCYSLAAGIGAPESGKWPGHLVAILADKVLIDLTLDQANRPQHDIVLPMPLVAPLPPDFLAEDGQMAGQVNGCRVVYEARPSDHSFDRSNDWRSRKRHDGVVAGAIRRLKGMV